MKTIYFTSDYHFVHRNVIKFDNRPFETIEEHDATLISNWNSVVKQTDDIYFLGDFCMCGITKAEEIMKQLNGNKFFIKGNHDDRKIVELFKKYGTYLGELCTLTVEEQKITLCHYAMRVWDRSHHGTYHLYGHSHGSLPDDPNSLSFDVGIMNHGYYPISFQQVKEIMSKKTYQSIDKHRSR